jgi:hypothetical protein
MYYYYDDDGLHALVIPPTEDGEPLRETYKVMGSGLTVMRAPSQEVPGCSLLMATWADAVQEPPFEMELVHASRPRQEKSIQAIWEAEDYVGPKSVGASAFLNDWWLYLPTVVLLTLAKDNDAFQPVVGQCWGNGILKTNTTPQKSRCFERHAPCLVAAAVIDGPFVVADIALSSMASGTSASQEGNGWRQGFYTRRSLFKAGRQSVVAEGK